MMSKTEPTNKRIVIKLGTSLLTGGGRQLNLDTMSRLVEQVARLNKEGLEIIIVSSGAIAAGRDKLSSRLKLKGTALRQALASVGQSRLMNTYEGLFNKHEITVAQALLTKEDLSDRAGYLNARNTLLSLIELGVICIVNENDVVATDELQEYKFGDNDNLSAMVANLVDADLLLMLTDIAGLYTADPQKDPEAKLIPEVERIDARIERLADKATRELSTGGMVTKIEAAKLATSSGVTVVIADGRQPETILKVAAGESIGTRFWPLTSKLESRKRWMVSGLCNRGKLIVDSGAASAVKKQKRSLLPTGIREVEGKFSRGDVVTICDQQGTIIGCGIVNYGAEAVKAITGLHSDKITEKLGYDYGDEVVHRNNLAVF